MFGPVSDVPDRREVMKRLVQAHPFDDRPRVVDPFPEPVDLVLEPYGRSLGELIHDVVEPDGVVPGGQHGDHVHVGDVVVPREEHVARIAADTDVGDVVPVRQPVERRVGLDEAPMGLGIEVGDDRFRAARLHVQPR